MKPRNVFMSMITIFALMVIPTGAQAASNILFDVGEGCTDVGPSSTNPLPIATAAAPYVCAGKIKIEPLDPNQGDARIIVNDGGSDIIQFVNAKITALGTVSNFPIAISADFVSGPDTCTTTCSDLFYKLSVDGEFVVPAQRFNYIKVKQYVTNPMEDAPRMLGTEKTKTVTNPTSTLANKINLDTSGEWIGAPDQTDMSSDRHMEIQTNIKLTANKVMKFGAGFKVENDTTAGDDGAQPCTTQTCVCSGTGIPQCSGSPGCSKCQSSNPFITTTQYSKNCLETASLTEDGVLIKTAKLRVFSTSNWESLSQDMVRGQGEYLASLASLMGIPPEQEKEFFAMAQEHYRVQSPEQVMTPEGTIKGIQTALVRNPSLGPVIR